MRSKLVQGRKSINCANSVLPAYILNPREMVPENLADTRFCVQVDTTPKATIPSSTQQVARYNRVLNRTAVARVGSDARLMVVVVVVNRCLWGMGFVAETEVLHHEGSTVWTVEGGRAEDDFVAASVTENFLTQGGLDDLAGVNAAG